MKLCIPAMSNDGTEATICNHFGSAPGFVLYDPETSGCEWIINTKAGYEHGQCRPMDLLTGCGIGAIICKGMGKSAVAVVQSQGIKVFLSHGTTVRDAVDDFMAGRLVKPDPEAGCKRHRHH